jgi:hypothetical protein
MGPDDLAWWEKNWRDRGPWSEPDKFEKYEPTLYLAVWYGINQAYYGVPCERPEAVSSVELAPRGFIFTEYQHISMWSIDEPYDPKRDGDFYRMSGYEADPNFVKRVIQLWIKNNGGGYKLPDNPIDTARWFASMGSAVISYYGDAFYADESKDVP